MIVMNFRDIKLKPQQLKTLLLLQWIGVLSVAASGCSNKPADGAAGSGAGKRPPARIYVGTVETGEVIPRTIVVGTIVAKRTSMVASGADGKVNQFLVRQGDIVEENQDLSILNMVTTELGIKEAEKLLEMRKQEWEELKTGSRKEEIAKAFAEREAAREAMEAAKRKADRQRQLSLSNAVNMDDFDSAIERELTTRSLFAAADAAYQLVNMGPREEQIKQAEARYLGQQDQVDYLIAEKGKRTTKAPFRGVIVAEHTQAGEWLSKGDPVVTISDLLEEVYIFANVDQREIENVRPGAEVQIEVNAPGKQSWQGVVESFVPRSQWESGSRTFPVKVVVKNEIFEASGQKQARLAEGMYARVTFTGVPRQSTLVPKNAVVRSENGSRVVTVLPGETPGTGTAKLVMIEEGTPYGDSIEVLAGDLQPGAMLVVEGAERLSPFQPVQIDQPKTPKFATKEKPDSVSGETD